MENGELDITNVPLSLYDQILDAEGQLQARYRDKAMLGALALLPTSAG